MKKLLLVGLGAGVGYVLGARAGRPTYDAMAHQAREISRRLGVPQMRDDLAAAGVDLTDAAKQQAARQMDDVTAKATDAIHRTAADLRGSTTSPPVSTSAGSNGQ